MGSIFMLLDRVDIRPEAADRTWRSDSLLSDPFSEFCTGFEEFQSGAGPKPKLGLADRYVRFALELAENWGSQDKETHRLEHHLFRRGRAEKVAIVVPDAFRNDEIVRVDTPDQAADFSQLMFEVRNRSLAESERRMAEWDRRRVEEIVSEPEVMQDVKQNGQVNGTVGSGIKALRVFNVLPTGAVPILHNEDSGSSQPEVRNLCPGCGRVGCYDSSKFCERHIEELIMKWKPLKALTIVKSTEQ